MLAGRLKTFWRDQRDAFRRLFGVEPPDWEQGYRLQSRLSDSLIETNRNLQRQVTDYQTVLQTLNPCRVARLLALPRATVVAADRWYAEYLERRRRDLPPVIFDWGGLPPPTPIVRAPPALPIEGSGTILYRDISTGTGTLRFGGTVTQQYPNHEPEDL